MEQCSHLGWSYCGEQEGVGELKRFLVQTTMELEATVMAAQDEILRKEEEKAHVRDLLTVVVKERDEAQFKCQQLLLDKLTLQQQLQQLQSQLRKPIKDGSAGGRGGETNCGNRRGGDTNATSFSSDDSEDSIISEPAHPQLPSPSSSNALPPRLAQTLGKKRALPEKGKLLQAVMEAGPTLQTLLLAGPLPQWQHPPPQLDSNEIPLVTIPASPAVGMPMHQDPANACCLVNTTTYINNKRGFNTFAVSSPTCLKYPRMV